MGLAFGSRLGPYEVIAPLGAGGMGLVYRARDTKLNRDVALKVLPPSFVHDVERVARFRRDDVDPHLRYVDVGPDDRFLIVESVQPESAASLVLVQHWDEELKRLLPNK